MEAQIQTKLRDKVKELRRQNRKLMNELLEAKAQLDKYKQDVNILTRHVVMLENIVLDLINANYGDKVKVDFTKFELCVDQRCVRFGEYEELLIALRILPFLI
jgi:predicted ribosome quality control (RQC) complex YloA/Tae2 family protein